MDLPKNAANLRNPELRVDGDMSDGLNLLHPLKDMAEMVIVFCVSPIVPEGLVLWT